MSFINKNWKKAAPGALTDALTRAAGVVGTGLFLKKVFPEPANANDESQVTRYNIGGPIMLLGGLALDVFAANPLIKTVAQGMTLKGMERTISAFVPSIADTMGLGAVAIASTTEPAQTQAKKDAALMGAAGDAKGLPSGLPEEFATVKEADLKNDGNPWNEVADEIDNPKTTIKVEGVEDAELMGEEISEEDAKLMGMF